MKDTSFNAEVARRLGCDTERAEAAGVVVLRELRDRLTPGEAADVAAQLPHRLKQVWTEGEHPDRLVRKTHRAEFVGRVRQRLSLADDAEAERTVRAVFGALQMLLGARSPMEGEAWDIFSQLPKDLKPLWIESGAKASG
jgi:uncharacterized protein (DUF2267 family)